MLTSYLSKSDQLFVDTLTKGLEEGDPMRLTKCRVALQAFLNKPRSEIGRAHV